MKTQITVEKLFKMCGVDWKELKPGDWVDVSSKGIKVSTYNEDTKSIEKKLVTKLVRKQDCSVFSVQMPFELELFKGSPAHKVFASTDGKVFSWRSLAELKEKQNILVRGVGEKDFVSDFKIVIKDFGAVYPILDFEVEDNHNYFANGVLSHNTTTGGNALKFYTSIRLTVRRKENVEKDGKIIGIISKVKAIKNKVAPPFKDCELKLLFGKGYQVEEEYVIAFVKRALVEKSASWFSFKYKTIEGKDQEVRVQGMDRLVDWFKEHPDVFETFKRKVQDMIAAESSVEVKTEETEEKVIAEQTRLEKEALSEELTAES